MLHTQLHGTHWQIGFQLGAGLARDGHFILDAVPFPITPARLEFARTCLPLCRRWFPAALEELRGLAQGQGCAPDELAGVLFSMYAMPPGPCCSCFALRRGRGALFGRNSDFLTELEEHNANCLYRFSDGGYSFVGNTTSFLQMEDGVNQFGMFPSPWRCSGSSPSPPATRWCWPTGLGVSPWRSVPRSAPRSIVPGRRTPSSAPSIPSTSPPWPPSAGRRTTTGGRKSAI